MFELKHGFKHESTPCLSWNGDSDASFSLLNQIDSYLKEAANKFFPDGTRACWATENITKSTALVIPTNGLFIWIEYIESE